MCIFNPSYYTCIKKLSDFSVLIVFFKIHTYILGTEIVNIFIFLMFTVFWVVNENKSLASL